VQAGESAAVGAAIALVAETEAEIEQAKQQAAGASAAAAPAAPAAAPVAVGATAVAAPVAPPAATTAARNGRIVASPRAKKLAKEFGVDIAGLTGSGPHGRIIAEDVESAAGKTSTPADPAFVPAAASPAAPKPAAAPPPPPAQPGQVVPLNTFQTAVVKNMVAAMQAPVFRVGYSITTTELDKLYKQIKPKGVTMTALLAKAVAVTLQKHPLVNAAYTEAGISYPSGINVAIAVAMDDGGLITPVLKNADQMDIYSLSRSWKDLVDRARTKQLQPDEYSTGTFTLSNLGMFGVDRFDAILPPGQGSILAIGASRPQVVASKDGMMGVKSQMQVNITCDHRIIYGAHAAAFLQDLAKLIETNAQSLTM
jgi:pyruvate dehydrogenase E2 component (dihydrolipoamide acetyltransferase)